MLSNLVASINVGSPSTMIPLVGITGFLDGIHPCAIAILIFFVAFLLTMQKNVKNIFFLGLVYIFVIFLTYLGIGVGFFSGVMLFGRHHFFAELGSWLLIIMGIIQVKDYFFPQLPIHPVRDVDKRWYKRILYLLYRISNGVHLRMPTISGGKIKSLLEKATLPAIIGAAFLVGLCSVPCSGGIYAAVTALLASQTTFLTGFLYLMLYNFMFVLPLLILLAFAANPITLAKIANFRQKNERLEKLIMGILMLAVGTSILIFFI